MLFKFFLFATLLLFSTSLFSELLSQSSKDYKEKILVQNFESLELSKLEMRVWANTNYLPDMKLSKILTSPDLQSNTSLTIRTLAGMKGIPFDISFKEPLVLDDFIIEFEFNIYSNDIKSDLYLILQDTKFQVHKILISHLNFDGWKQIKVSVQNQIYQNDFVLNSKNPIKLIGFAMQPSKLGESTERENILAIDDFFYIKRQKYKLPNNGLEYFH